MEVQHWMQNIDFLFSNLVKEYLFGPSNIY